MTNLSTFVFQDQDVRVVGSSDNPMWVAQDVCDVLDIGEASNALRKFDSDEKGMFTIQTPGGEQDVLVVTEPGLYRIIFKSRKPNAKSFQRWVFHEVLPSIRKTGSYAIAQQKKPETPKALQAAHHIKEIYDMVNGISPRIQQFLIDNCVSEMFDAKALPPSSDRLRGVVEIAQEMGYKVGPKNRSMFGKFMSEKIGDTSVEEERLVNGTFRKVKCYPDNQKTRDTIASYFDGKDELQGD